MVEQKKTRSFAGKMLALAGATLLIAITSAGCAAEVDSQESDTTEVASVQAPLVYPECPAADFGHYTCTTTGLTYDYSVPACGEWTKSIAYSQCTTHCSGGTCQDSGWGH